MKRVLTCTHKRTTKSTYKRATLSLLRSPSTRLPRVDDFESHQGRFAMRR